MSLFKHLEVEYMPGSLNVFTGRQSDEKNAYWYQNIMVDDISNKQMRKTDVSIIGYECDEGVLRNQGRIGAKEGAKEIRKQLGKLPVHTNKIITDFGNVICVNNNLEDCQKALSKAISSIIKNKSLPIALGGGHDIAYANFNGIKSALANRPNNKIGIINFDAHFDLRPVEKLPNSGTPFYQILADNNNLEYFVIGIQHQSNSRLLFDIAKDKKVSYISNYDCQDDIDLIKTKLSHFIKNVDFIYLTIDLDGFSSAFAPGVSAPSSLGFSPYFVFSILPIILNSNKIISVDIAELNPRYDIDNHTSRLAAKLVDFIISSF